MRHVCGGAALLMLGVLVLSGAIYDTARADDTVEYTVFTYDPPCTAAYLDGLEMVTRLTFLNEQQLYVPAGMPIRIQIQENMADDTVQTLLERPRILSVQRVGPFPNGTDAEWPVMVNPNATTRDYAGNCYAVDSILEWKIHRALVRQDQGSGGASGTGYTDPFWERTHETVYIFVPDAPSIASMVEYLEANGATVWASGSKEYKGRLIPQVYATVPIPLLVSLTERDDFQSVVMESPVAQLVGSENTAGVGAHNADEWHAAGYDRTGINVGVIDGSFGDIRTASTSGGLPPLADIGFMCHRNVATIAGCVSDGVHGTAVAEIVMDMAPGANLFIGRVSDVMHGGYNVTSIVNWMVGQDVDVIVASVSPHVFEGPGDGTTPHLSGTWLDAITHAVRNNVTWVNSAGDYADGKDWSIRDPRTNNGLIVFGTGNDTTNQFEASAGQRVDVWLQWYDADNNNADLNLLVAGASQHTGVADQWGGTSAVPIESVTFVPASSGQWNISLAVIGAAVPDWIHLFVDGSAGDLEYHTNEGIIADPAESGNHSMPAAGAPATPGAAYGSGPDDTTVDLAITSHNPVCTALVLDALGATRFTDIYPSYSADDMINGVNVTAAVWARDTNMTMAALVGQPEVSRVAAYSPVPQNATSERPAPLALATDPDADMRGGIRGCSKNVAHGLATHAMAGIGWAGAEPGTGPRHTPDAGAVGASGSGDGPGTGSESLTLDPNPGSRLEGNLIVSLDGTMAGVDIWTHDIRATWAFVQENGGLVTSVPRDYEDRPLGAISLMGSYLPLDLLGSFMLRDEISAINAGGPPILE